MKSEGLTKTIIPKQRNTTGQVGEATIYDHNYFNYIHYCLYFRPHLHSNTTLKDMTSNLSGQNQAGGSKPSQDIALCDMIKHKQRGGDLQQQGNTLYTA